VILVNKVRKVTLDQKGLRALMAYHSTMHLMMENYMAE